MSSVEMKLRLYVLFLTGASELSRMYPTPPSHPESYHDPNVDTSCPEAKPVIKHEPFTTSATPEDMTKVIP